MIRLCEQCGLRNDPKRVICQDCGAPLPDPQPDGGAPVAPPAAYQPPPPVFKASKKEYAALKTVKPRHTVRNLVLLSLLCFAGGLSWAVSKAIQPVTGLRPPVTPSISTPAHVQESLSKAAALGRGKWVGPVGAVNQFLASASASRPLFEVAGMAVLFQRSYIETGEGSIDLVMVLDAGGRILVCRLGMVPVAKDGGTWLRFTGASIGGLEIPEFAAGYFAPLWKPCVEPFERLLSGVSSAKQVEITPEALIVQWSGSSR